MGGATVKVGPLATIKEDRVAKTKMVICTETFHAPGKHGIVSFETGRSYKASLPAVKTYPQFFEAADVWAGSQAGEVVHAAVEAATAAPGETRTVKKPVKAKADADS